MKAIPNPIRRALGQSDAGRGRGVDRSTTVVFLHIPKTAGQTIHAELTRVMGTDAASPIRVHSQAKTPEAQMPPGYRLYSGHIDWGALETLPEPRFVFTVLRDPLERMASFYFYLRKEAERLGPAELENPGRVGMRKVSRESADDYFFGGDPMWQRFIYDHYHSTYCTYLVTRRMRGYGQIAGMAPADLVDQAEAVARGLDGVYSVDGLGLLEHDLKVRLGFEVDLRGRVVNAGPQDRSKRRWPALEALLSEASVVKLKRFVWADQMLMARLGLGADPGARP
ncbi:sulfotransferase family 2 domain-containing protein [Cognatishimia sp. F0-27]|uniref:sulfotransferase family 2 domain-containing protein n=1 Tax=Cognatishimia sp. F0-27 TaxID=2816855 RepID=UPI001D0C5DC1|nr:sulfotransferase family 2 domain-containing protein [Cognatishimia sp. F0-27]MCC1494822.1 sulfotransferase family 2 domain-containing protein [Cognatishimia sp. F0-27]